MYFVLSTKMILRNRGRQSEQLLNEDSATQNCTWIFHIITPGYYAELHLKTFQNCTWKHSELHLVTTLESHWDITQNYIWIVNTTEYYLDITQKWNRILALYFRWFRNICPFENKPSCDFRLQRFQIRNIYPFENKSGEMPMQMHPWPFWDNLSSFGQQSVINRSIWTSPSVRGSIKCTRTNKWEKEYQLRGQMT